jgi:uncharacterized protein
MPPRRVQITILHNNNNITSTAILDLLTITYEENLSGASSKLDLAFYSASDRKLTNLPNIGDTIEVRLQWQGESKQLATGLFRVDDRVPSFGADNLTISGIGWDYGLDFVNKTGLSYTNATLRAIVQTQAAAPRNLTVIGNISTLLAGTIPDGQTQPRTQTYSSRLELLRALALMYGYAFNLRYGQLFFRDIYDLERQATVKLITRVDVRLGAQFRRKLDGLYRQAQTNYLDGSNTVVSTMQDTSIPAVVTAQINLQSEGLYPNLTAAQRRGTGAILEANSDSLTTQFTTEGDCDLVAGAVITLSDFGSNDGSYLITRTVHTVDASSGWTVQIDARFIPPS